MDIGTEECQSGPSGIGSQGAEDLPGSLMDIVTEESQSGPSGVGSREAEEVQGEGKEADWGWGGMVVKESQSGCDSSW